MVGIYKITNQVNGKAYVGLSINIDGRFSRHKSTAFNPNSPGYEYPLYRAIRKYGLESFSFEIIEECDSSELCEKEIYYIALYDTYYNGYNQDKGGNSASHFTKLSEDIVDEIIELLKTSKENSDIIGAEFGVTGRMIRGINSGEFCHRDDENYPIRGSIIEKRQDKFCINCGVKITFDAKGCCPKCSHLAQRRVARPEPLDLANMIKEKGFSEVGRHFGVDCNSIKKWCKAYGIPHKLNDLIIWYDEQVGITEHPKLIETRNNQKASVEQIDLKTGKVIATFDSFSSAASSLGLKKATHISEACRGLQETAYGFKWRYAS